jgi:hypothetical protein
MNYDIPTIEVRREGETEWNELCGEEKKEYARKHLQDDMRKRQNRIGYRLDQFLHRIRSGWYYSQIKSHIN